MHWKTLLHRSREDHSILLETDTIDSLSHRLIAMSSDSTLGHRTRAGARAGQSKARARAGAGAGGKEPY
jgi:hypothetical protein